MDLDLNVYRASGQLQGTGNNNQSFFDPEETVCFPFNAAHAPYEIEVRRRNGSMITGSRISIFTARHNLESAHRVREESLLNPANAIGAFAVASIAAINWNLPAPNTQGYSSRGPTTDGRIKPDLAGMDGISTSTLGATGGTSFASPHVAGAAALLLAQDPSLTALQLRNELQAIAIDQGDPGIDNLYGAGQMVADESLGGLLDTDLDTVGNQADNCRYEPNPPPQLDTGGIGATVSDGVGDACQCGDVDDDGSVLQSDVDTLRAFFAGTGVLPAAAKCNVAGPADGGVSDCDQVDAVVTWRTLAIQPPFIAQVCSPALP